MNRKIFIFIIGSLLGVTLLSGIIFVAISHPDKASVKDEDQSAPVSSDITGAITDIDDLDDGGSSTYFPPIPEEDYPSPGATPTVEPEIPFVPAAEMDLEPSSITVFVNKEFALPKKYKPDDLITPNVYFDLSYYDDRTLLRSEAAKALERLFAAAYRDGYKLSGVSGYRSYSRQYQIFTNNILTKGKAHTLKYSAVPGTSEHQTGLAIDVSCESLGYDLSTSFSDTPEGKWLADNAYRFGYIIRYPKGKGSITGYAYEPWHIRYVGKGLAKYLYENDLTLEEYYKYEPSKNFDFEAKYADLINITPTPTVTPIVSPTVLPSVSPTVLPSISPIPSGDISGIPEEPDGEISITPTPTGDGSEVTPTIPGDGQNPEDGGDDPDASGPEDGSQDGSDGTGAGIPFPTPAP